MTGITTLNQIITWFRQYAEQHPTLRDFGYGATDMIGTTRPLNFPYMWIASTNSNPITISNHIIQPEFEFLAMFVDALSDQTQVTEENGYASNNEQEVLSDTYQIIQDFIAWLNSSWRATGITLGNVAPAQPVSDTTPDRVSGWAFTFSLKIPYNQCVTGIDVKMPNISTNLTTQNAVSASYALTASYALNAAAGEPLPEIWQHPQALTGSQYIVKQNHNGLLVGPVSFSNNIDVQTGANLIIL